MSTHSTKPGQGHAKAANPLPLPQWLTLLCLEYLPAPYVVARRAELEALWREGATPGLACTYARVHMLAPRLEGVEYAGPTHAAPVWGEREQMDA